MMEEREVSRETLLLLEHFADTLRKWNERINLVAPSSLGDVWQRHIDDSAQLLDLAPPAQNWVDLGSGGGLPGMVVAILARDTRPGMRVTLIESDQRKAAFLQSVARECAPEVRVLAVRIEDAPAQNAGIVSARALAPLPRLLGLVGRHLASDGAALLPKGKSYASELDQARREWQFVANPLPSRTNPEARILVLKDIARA